MPRESQPVSYETLPASTAVPEDWLAGEDEAWADDYRQSEAEKTTRTLTLWRVGVLCSLLGAALWVGLAFLVYHVVAG